MGVFEDIQVILIELLDVEEHEIRPERYLVRDLGVESIDFLELAVSLNERFGVEVHDDTVFLRNLRLYLSEAAEKGAVPLDYLRKKYAFLTTRRIGEILSDLTGGPVIQVQDLVGYIQWQKTVTQAA